LLPGSVLIGDIYLANSNFIFGNGLNALLSFKPGSSLPTSIDTNGMPSVVDSDDMQIAVADTTGFAMADETLGDLTQSVMDAVSRRLHTEESTAARYARLATGEIVSPAGRDLSTSDVVWGEALGAWREQEASSPVWSSDHHLTGIVSGFDGVLSEAYHAGIFLGAAQSQLAVDDNAQEIDTQSLFGGMYVSRRAGPVISDLTILAGWQENDSERLIANNTAATGVEVAEASYDGIFLAPQVTLGMEFPAVTPSLTLGYAGLFLEEYEEQGSTAALTVDSRSVHSLLSRAQLALPRHYELADGRSLSIEHRIGIEGRYSFGSDVSATLLAQSITFEPGGDDLVANLFAGSDVALRSITGRSALRLGVLASAGSDGSLVLSSGLGGEFLF
jgi:outer membrane autotransporter protein